MPFLQLTLTIGAADPEPFEDALLAAGAISITLEDAEDAPVLEPAPGTTPLWPSVCLKALFEGDASSAQIVAVLTATLPQLPETHFETIEDRAWEREWLKDFRPMQFGRRLWISPGGQLPPANAPESASQVIVTLDPGLAFGTGTHPTTALCLEWLDSAELADKRVLDFGCGSGVLAIAALKLGAREALAVDIDPQALQAARDNGIRNEVAGRLRVCDAAAVATFEADVLLANILAEPLKTLAPRFAELLRPEGRIVLSGILVSQAGEVASSYAPWFDIAPASLRDDWVRLEGTRRPRRTMQIDPC
jgi:ribosomal protein L11 methyltransferase